MHFAKTELDGVVLMKPDIFQDARGIFFESYHQSKFFSAGITDVFVQSNHSRSLLHSLRGLHAQVKHPQGKLVRVITGVVFDVAVDLRKESSSFGQYVGLELSADNRAMVVIPPGFAHGFQTLTDDVELIYFHTASYSPKHEGGVNALDETVGINWPLAIGDMSDRDRALPRIANVEPIQV